LSQRRIFGLVALVVGLVFVGTVGWMVWSGAREPRAPSDPGICWKRDADMKFVVLMLNSQGIEACAGDLERIHMKTGESLVGAYQGRYIYVDSEAIRSSSKMSDPHWRLFFDNQRQTLDKDLNAHDMVFTTKR
jgi:hypothetical protein